MAPQLRRRWRHYVHRKFRFAYSIQDDGYLQYHLTRAGVCVEPVYYAGDLDLTDLLPHTVHQADLLSCSPVCARLTCIHSSNV